MILALFALATLMIVGGAASVIQGFPFVRLESGLAMVIAGATTASAGAVVLAIAALAGRVRALARVLEEGADQRLAPDSSPFDRLPQPDNSPAGYAAPSVAPREDGSSAPAIDIGSAGRRPALAGLAGAGGLAAIGAAAERSHSEPILSEPTFHDDPPKQEAEPFLPGLPPLPEPQPGFGHDPVIDPPPIATTATEEPRRAESDLFVAPPPVTEEADEPIALRPAIESEPAAEAAPVEAIQSEAPPAPPAAEPQVVGTYASGGNTYVMYATGVIEADTPRGRFTFGSLDELKAFVEAGGEMDARGAA